MNNQLLDDKKLLKEILKEALSEFFVERKDILEDALIEVIEDIGLSQAIDEGLKSESISQTKFMKRLKEKIDV